MSKLILPYTQGFIFGICVISLICMVPCLYASTTLFYLPKPCNIFNNQKMWVFQLHSFSTLFWLFEVVPWDSTWILGQVFFFICIRSAIGVVIRIILNLYVTLGNIAILTTLFFSSLKCSVFSFICLLNDLTLFCSFYSTSLSPPWLILKYFIHFDLL